MSHCLINGQPMTRIPAQNRGLAFGDGVFETCYSQHGSVRFLEDHLRRLRSGVSRLQLRWSDEDDDRLRDEIQSLVSVDNEPAVIKLILVRHSEGRGYDFDPATQSTQRLVMRLPYRPPPWASQSARLVVSRQYASSNPGLAGIKHLNRLDSVLARQDARRQQADEALLCLPNGEVVEGTMSNIYLQVEGRWVTPDLHSAGVDGIIRRRLLAEPHSNLVTAVIHKTQLQHTEVAMISNSLIGLVPVTELDGRVLSPPVPDELETFRRLAGLNHG
ncbi:MAG: aminodeoxychorismate lyase [Saccharospirillum sp.]